jgi:hypothetical protein
LPYLIGGTITGIIITRFQGFLFSIIVNSVAWFAISTVVNKYYWNYTGFRDEMHLVSKYIIHRKKNRSKNTPDNIESVDKRITAGGGNSEAGSNARNPDNDKTGNIGSPIK